MHVYDPSKEKQQAEEYMDGNGNDRSEEVHPIRGFGKDRLEW